MYDYIISFIDDADFGFFDEFFPDINFENLEPTPDFSSEYKELVNNEEKDYSTNSKNKISKDLMKQETDDITKENPSGMEDLNHAESLMRNNPINDLNSAIGNKDDENLLKNLNLEKEKNIV